MDVDIVIIAYYDCARGCVSLNFNLEIFYEFTLKEEGDVHHTKLTMF